MRTEKIGQGLPLPQEGARDQRPQVSVWRGTTDGDIRPSAIQEIQGFMTPGAIPDSRMDRLEGNLERAQSSHKGHKLHGTNTDPWAIQDRRIDEAEHWGETEGTMTLGGGHKLPPWRTGG